MTYLWWGRTKTKHHVFRQMEAIPFVCIAMYGGTSLQTMERLHLLGHFSPQTETIAFQECKVDLHLTDKSSIDEYDSILQYIYM